MGVGTGRHLQEHMLDSFHSPPSDDDGWHLVSPRLSLPWYNWGWRWGKSIGAGHRVPLREDGACDMTGTEMTFLTVQLTSRVFLSCT